MKKLEKLKKKREKRLKKERKKQQALLSQLPIKTPAIPISVTKVDLSFNPLKEATEEDILGHELSVADVEAMFKELRKCIEEQGFTNSTTTSSPIHRSSSGKTLFVDTASKDPSRPFWFIGDLHGDLLALKALTDFASAKDKCDGINAPTRLFFLGDFTDDAPFSAEVVAWVMRQRSMVFQPLQEEHGALSHAKFEVMLVVGNHDDGLQFIDDDAGGKFVSTVSPSTFAEELNERIKAEELNERIKGEKSGAWKAFGKAAIDFFKGVPRMVMLNKIVMVAHGGVPHSDVQITKLEDLNSTQALSDFVWTRLHETAPKKFPDRESRGSQLGVKDYEGFISKLLNTAVVGFAPKIFIRGHDHHDNNFKRYGKYEGCLVLTLNAFTVNRSSYGSKFRDLAMLRWVPSDGEKMTLFRLKFQPGDLEEMTSKLATVK